MSELYDQILANEARLMELAEVLSDLRTCEVIIDTLRTLEAQGGRDG